MDSSSNYIFINIYYSPIPSAGTFRPTVIDKSWSMESTLRDHTRTFDSGVRARSASLPAEVILKILRGKRAVI